MSRGSWFHPFAFILHPYSALPLQLLRIHLKAGVEQASSSDELYAQADFISIHLPKTPETAGWLNADALSANAANSPLVRATLRNRARYEYANNSFCNGMIRTLAFHCIGTGPRLQLTTGNEQADRKLELNWQRWCKAIGLAGKLVATPNIAPMYVPTRTRAAVTATARGVETRSVSASTE